MNRNQAQITQENAVVGRDVHPLQSNQPDEANYDETRKKLCEISYMILDVYNAVGEYARPPCKCEDYQQELQLLQQKLHGTLEANRILNHSRSDETASVTTTATTASAAPAATSA
ncbi:hypothetical protein VDGE_30555 [Verticillium dahliae]|uniref:Uncharacterized protein n=1 Tax=Verticillium dahliae TaxID=27337 RepID=A0A444RIZ2_VERDA|nr:hypothetical protein VDGE_30555 [Verticillium dahliae]